MTRSVVVIDIQNEYFPGGALPLHEAEATEDRIVAALGRARDAGDRIILVQHVSDKPGLFHKDGAGVAIRPRILEAAGDAPVVTKSVADAFQDTDLAARLEGTTELVICGMMTQNCVVFTSMSRAAEGYDIRVAGDLCAAPSDVVHRIALNALGSKLKVVTAADVWS